MRVSHFPIFTLKDTPADAEVISHKLMIRSGMIRKLSSGQYSWLPLGLRVIKKIEAIIRNELEKIGCSEILMPSVQPSELWQESGRWEQYGPELLRFADRHQRNFCLGPTFEEVITDLIRKDVSSYKQLPINLFQISTKFRDEIRPRFGVMRAREFIMKDAYSFHANQQSLDETYEIYKNAYNNIFKNLMLDFTIVDADSGNIGGNESNEFHVIADTGEDDLLLDDDLKGMNIEIAKVKYGENDLDALIKKTNLTHKKGIEVGHIFKLGQKYSEKMKAKVTTKDSKTIDMYMGCYGIGVTRIVAAAIEQLHDNKGIKWPASITPFNTVIIEIDGHKNSNVRTHCESVYEELIKKEIETIYDDRDTNLGKKIKDWELIGIPNIVIIGKSESNNNTLILKRRSSESKSEMNINDLLKNIVSQY
jgi:prolyl-tRNA synthetase